MAEAAPLNTTIRRKTTVSLFNEVTQIIKKHSFNEVRDFMETLHTEECKRVLNSSRDDKTLIVFAIIQRKTLTARYLLNLSLDQGRCIVNEIWKKTYHPLKSALNANNIPMIHEISRNLQNINEFCHGPYTPLMLAIYTGELEHVRRMVDMGADVNLSNGQNGRTPLMIAVPHTNICRFLIRRNADLDLQDENGDTALHKAIAEGHTMNVKQIIEGGADVQIRNNEGLSPLMLAVTIMDITVMHYLASMNVYSSLLRIESTEIINAIYAVEGFDVTIHWVRAFQCRQFSYPRNSPYQPQAILDYFQEFSTEEELESMKNNQLHLAYQGILVIERILGRKGKLYLRALLRTTKILKSAGNIDKLHEFIEYIKEVSQTVSPRIVSRCSSWFSKSFDDFLAEGPDNFFENGGFAIFEMISRASEEMWILIEEQLARNPIVVNADYTTLLNRFLYMTSKIAGLSLSRQQLKQFYGTVARLVRKGLRDEHEQSLLHGAINLYNSKPWATLELLVVLLRSGADVNAKDYLRRTPLFYAILRLTSGDAADVVRLLVDYGAHLDCKTSEGFTILDYPLWISLSLIPNNPRKLQCLAAEVVLDNRIDYEDKLNNYLKNFLKLHI